MDTNERGNDRSVSLDRDTRINVILNNPDAANDTINIGRILQNFKKKRRIYAWVLLFCFVACICASLLWYQFTASPDRVSSVVTLDYEIPNPLLDPAKNPDFTPTLLEDETIPHFVPVPDLTAPDGSALDLSALTSSYVLQMALNGLDLSEPISLSNLSDNIRIERILSQDSRRSQEIATGMVQEKNSNAYAQLQNFELTYENKFIATLVNGFGDEDSRVKRYLTTNELRLLLDRILIAYNEYLASAYADITKPDDEFSIIDTQALDFQESLDMIRTATDNLYDYCNDKSDTIRTYRSWRTGLSLNDLMSQLEQIRRIDVDYLYATVVTDSIARDPEVMLTSLQYQLRSAQNDLEKVNEDIASTQRILNSYKNDEVIISMEDSGETVSATATTTYYSKLIQQMNAYYARAATLGTNIADLKDRVAAMRANGTSANVEAYGEALEKALENCKACYADIQAQMSEIINSPFYTTYSEHTTAELTSKGFIASAYKKVIIGALAGLVIGFGLWFLAALAEEFRYGRHQSTSSREVGEK